MNTAKTLEVITNLSTTNRFSKSYLVKDESVLEHSSFVCMMSYFIGTAVNKENPGRINIGSLLSKAITHDIDESITADIQRTVKYHNDKVLETFHEISNDAVIKISDFTETKELLKDWREAKIGDDGKIVGICDTMAVIYKAHNEVCILSNKGIDFGGVKSLRCLFRKRIKGLIIAEFPENVVSDIDKCCNSMLDKIYEETNEN